MIGGWNGFMSGIRTLVLSNVLDEIHIYLFITEFLGWVAGTGLTCRALRAVFSCAIILLDGLGVDPFAIVFIIHTRFGLPKKS